MNLATKDMELRNLLLGKTMGFMKKILHSSKEYCGDVVNMTVINNILRAYVG